VKQVIAIDPGSSGGIAWKGGDGFLGCQPMPDTHGDLCDLLRSLIAAAPESVVYLEKVNGFMGTAAPGSAMFNFGRGVGYIEGCLAAMGCPVIEVPPQKWIKAIGLGTRGEMTKCEWKNKLKGEAQRRYPALTVTLKTADALLILASVEVLK